MNRNNFIICLFCTVLLIVFTVRLDLAFGQVDRFKLEGSRAIEVWRITNDPTIRDHANYHCFQCWSPDGGYLCYTHYATDDKETAISGGAEVHIYDLYKNRDIKIDNGSDPRWANKHNWLFFTQSLRKDGPSYGKGTQVIWLDIESQKLTRIVYGLQNLKGTDCDDKWLYGYQTLADRKTEKARVSIKEDSMLEILPGDWGAGYNSLYINPSHPIIVSRDHNYVDYLYAREGIEKPDIPYVGRHFLDHNLDGSGRTSQFPIMDGSHFSWDGSGSYFLAGNYQARGRKWDEPLPSNIHFLSTIDFGDVCPCGFSGRWICGSTSGGRGPLRLADTRSGDGWEVLKNHSFLCFPGTRDNSGPYDIDAKGSPDGTKIAFISTYDIKNAPWTEVIEDVTGDIIKVKSTNGFPEKGRLVNNSGFGGEVLSYERKTETTFEGLKKGLYGTNSSAILIKGQTITSFESSLIPEDKWNKMPLSARGRPIRNAVQDMDSPLMRQRMSDLYVAVVRLPDRPYLQKVEDYIELIPGENHWETFGYYVYRDGKRITDVPVKPGTSLILPEAGTYTAIAVERSGLESKQSLPLDVQGKMKLKVLNDKPSDFSWTNDRWSVSGKEVSEEEAKRAAESVKEIVHLYDGVIHLEWYNWGQIVLRHDLNLDGKPIRRLFYQEGKLTRREYYNSDGMHISTELFDSDGYITEAIQYETVDNKLVDTNHWWYEKAVPVKNIVNSASATAVYVKDGSRWVRK